MTSRPKPPPEMAQPALYRAIQKSVRDAAAARPRRALGVQLLAELLSCSRLPSEASELARHMEETGRLIGATVVQTVFHEFNPHGLSGVVIIAESHIAIHTWPEFGCAALDIFTCGDQLTPQPGLDYLREVFGASEVTCVEIPRGLTLAR